MRVYVRTHICRWTLGVVMFVAPASGEPRAGAPLLSLSQLEGAHIHATLVTEMQAKQEGGSEGPATAELDWNVNFGPGGKIIWSYRPTIRARRGDQKGATISGTSGLDEAWPTENGDAMWQFNDGELIFVRSYQGGAMRLIIAIRQDGPNLTCAGSNVFAREGDKRDLIINSPIDGIPVTIFSWKQVSSNCEVTSPSIGFDGFWQTAVACEKQGNIPGWSYQFIGQVKNSVYHGVVGQEGKPGWTTYDGTIERDGSVKITQMGLVGDSRFALGRASSGTKFAWPFAGRFQETRGSALRVAGRTCHMDLVKMDFVKR